MVRVPLPFRGIAVLLLVASTAIGQSPEPPAELLSLDPLSPNAPDILRQFSADTRHPLLSLMVDGELTAFDASTSQDSSKLKPTPQSSSTAPKTEASEGASIDGCATEGGLLDGCSIGNAFPEVPNFLPFACPSPPPPPCFCRKCLRKCGRGRCGGCGYGNSNFGGQVCPGWCFYGAPLVPCYEGCCGRRFCRKHCCGGWGEGYGYGGGWGEGCNMMGGEGFAGDGFCGCMPYMPQPCCGHKCHRLFHRHCCGGSGCGSGYGGYMEGGFCGGCMPPPQCCCRRCMRKHSCQSGYGYSGYGYAGMEGCYGGMTPCYGCGYGCGKQHCGFGLFHRRRCCQMPMYPYCSAPMMMPCMGMGMGMNAESFCSDCGFSGGEGGLGMVMDGTIN